MSPGVTMRQTRTVLSALAVTIRWPSGENSRLRDPGGMALQLHHQLPVSRVPGPRAVFVRAGRHDALGRPAKTLRNGPPASPAAARWPRSRPATVMSTLAVTMPLGRPAKTLRNDPPASPAAARWPRSRPAPFCPRLVVTIRWPSGRETPRWKRRRNGPLQLRHQLPVNRVPDPRPCCPRWPSRCAGPVRRERRVGNAVRNGPPASPPVAR